MFERWMVRVTSTALLMAEMVYTVAECYENVNKWEEGEHFEFNFNSRLLIVKRISKIKSLIENKFVAICLVFK